MSSDDWYAEQSAGCMRDAATRDAEMVDYAERRIWACAINSRNWRDENIIQAVEDLLCWVRS